MSTFDELKAREEAAVCRTYGRYPLAIASGKGAHLYDLEGREYTDLLAGLAVSSLGHGREDLAQVMAEQAARLVHVSNLFYTEQGISLAEELLATCGADKAFFCNSGAEANEAAIKLARRAMRTVRGRDAWEIITLEGSFHGRTLATVAATGQAKFSQHFEPLPEGFVQVAFNDAAAVEAAITERTAAVLVEVVQGEGGVRPMDPDVARAIQQICRDKGVLFIVDEIQTGMCRTGRFWAHQHYDLEPDIITCAKALANGLPMGAMLARDEVACGFAPGTHATTFGGGPVLAAVARKVIAIMREQGLAERAAELGATLKQRIEQMAAKHPGKVDHVRGLGLMLGIVLTGHGKTVWQELLDAGFITNLTQDTVIRLLPPLIIDQADLDRFVEALDGILTKVPAAA